ncbi:DUF2089 family protein [Vescimonas sp.]|uniref:DUF2089 family protein n=1 Tax=Vescimonas sp. TaxID=2892404 RepID=UPI00307B8A24
MKFSGQCPVCGEHLHLARLACPGCKAEFPTDEPLLPYNYLSEEDAQFLKTFLVCRGSLKEVQAQMNISYPTAKKRLEELLLRLGLRGEDENAEEVDMSLFKKTETASTKASDIIRNKLYENGGKATVYSVSGKAYVIKASGDGKTFLCNELPIKPPFSYEVFDRIVELLIREGGSARKGMGRNFRLGEGHCTEDTVVGYIGAHYFGANYGTYVFDPVFVLAAVLEWAGIARNERGYLSLTADYLAKVR